MITVPECTVCDAHGYIEQRPPGPVPENHWDGRGFSSLPWCNGCMAVFDPATQLFVPAGELADQPRWVEPSRPRRCNCGSGQPATVCTANDQYCG